MVVDNPPKNGYIHPNEYVQEGAMSDMQDVVDHAARIVAGITGYKPLPRVVVHTDGSVLTNPGIGGWAVLLEAGETEDGNFRHSKQLSGASPHATNNQMELQAVIEAIMALKSPCEVTIVTDSQYIANGINRWFPEWDERGKPLVKGIMNPDRWQLLYLLRGKGKHTVKAEWVRGHSKHPKNDIVDKLAYAAAKSFKDGQTV